jgi:hypothetical protein
MSAEKNIPERFLTGQIKLQSGSDAPRTFEVYQRDLELPASLKNVKHVYNTYNKASQVS